MTYISPRFDQDRALFEASAAQDDFTLGLLEDQKRRQKIEEDGRRVMRIVQAERAINALSIAALLAAVVFVCVMVGRIILRGAL